MHLCSAEFEAEIERWEDEDVYIFHLPKYAPHLNLIETLWRKIKYEWLKQHHFIGIDFFFAALDAILKKNKSFTERLLFTNKKL